MERSEQKKSRDKLYDFFYRLLLFSACNRSKQNAKVTGIGVGAYFFLLKFELQVVFIPRRIKCYLLKDLKLVWI